MSPVVNRFDVSGPRWTRGDLVTNSSPPRYVPRTTFAARPCWILRLLTAVVACLMAASSGCRQNEPEFQVVTLDGTVEDVRADTETTGEITLRYYREKQGKEVLGTGLVTKETEIMIDGALAKLTDVRKGDKVRGEVRIESRQGHNVNVALRVFVERTKLTAPDEG